MEYLSEFCKALGFEKVELYLYQTVKKVRRIRLKYSTGVGQTDRRTELVKQCRDLHAFGMLTRDKTVTCLIERPPLVLIVRGKSLELAVFVHVSYVAVPLPVTVTTTPNNL